MCVAVQAPCLNGAGAIAPFPTLTLGPRLPSPTPPHTGVGVARLWLDRGDVVLIADSRGVRDIYSADGPAAEPRAPLTVLVNKGTGSAAEVRAAAWGAGWVQLWCGGPP